MYQPEEMAAVEEFVGVIATSKVPAVAKLAEVVPGRMQQHRSQW